VSEIAIDDRVAQVQVIPFRMDRGELEVLVLQRNEAKGGFWQPVTGGVNRGETVLDAAARELHEETGVTAEDSTVIDDGYTFKFTDMHRGKQRTFTEHVVAAVLHPGTEITRSPEHVDHRWESRLGALALLKYDSNKDALNYYWEIVENTYEQ
jgi:8-oxo-dGTP pyrophosphatase MutT (NUDIX family)